MHRHVNVNDCSQVEEQSKSRSGRGLWESPVQVPGGSNQITVVEVGGLIGAQWVVIRLLAVGEVMPEGESLGEVLQVLAWGIPLMQMPEEPKGGQLVPRGLQRGGCHC